MWEAGKRLFCTATGEYMREATITIFILLFHLILPGASDGGKDVAYADAFILPFYPSSSERRKFLAQKLLISTEDLADA